MEVTGKYIWLPWPAGKDDTSADFTLHPDDVALANAKGIGYVKCIRQEGEYRLFQHSLGRKIRIIGTRKCRSLNTRSDITSGSVYDPK